MSDVRTRFAPSPTGFLHIGSLRTALYSYAFAKSLGGKFILRIEDTDQKRLVPGSLEKIQEILKIFGLNWDEGPFIQSERTKTGVYQKYADQLIKQGNAYYCFCPVQDKEEIKEEHSRGIIKSRDVCRDLPPEEAKKRIDSGEKPAIRLRVPDNETVSFADFVIKKEISWETKFVDEVMLLKTDGFPTYHLAAMVDDFEMKISHVMRGRDWLPSTPAHLLIMKYLGFPRPEICHLSDILDPEGGKMSKRKGAVACEEFLTDGYLPEAILNFVMLIGWAPKDNREFFSLQEFVDNFQKGELQIANPVFNRKKLDWFNGECIRKTSDEKLMELLKPFIPLSFQTTEGRSGNYMDILAKVIPLVKERMIKLSEFPSFAGFFFSRPKVDKSLFQNLPYEEHLKAAGEVLKIVEPWSNEKVQESLTKLIQEKNWKAGDFYMSLRITLTGSRFTPPITESAVILDKKETLLRISL